MDKVYRVTGLTKDYAPKGPVANKGISFEISKGEIFGVFGPNGAGKTTLIRQMAGLLRPTEGKILLFDADVVAQPSVVTEHVGYYGQKVVALRTHRFREVLEFTGRHRGLSRADARRQTVELIAQFDYQKKAERLLFRMSGGENRLAGLLAAFMGCPPVLILDEPTNGLDPATRRRVWEYLQERIQLYDTTVVLVTHNLLEAEDVVDRVVIIDEGVVRVIGTPGALKQKHSSEMRVEVRLREEERGGYATSLRFPRAIDMGRGRWWIPTSRQDAARTLAEVLTKVEPEHIDDFKLVAPALEEVYVAVTGKAWEG